MNRLLAVLIALSLLVATTACGHPLKGHDRTYPTYGLLNDNTKKSKNVCYEVSIGNLVWSVILVETVIAPVYFIGFSIENPVREKKSPDDTCNIDS